MFNRGKNQSIITSWVNLSGADFNSVLLNVVRERLQRQRPSAILQTFKQNRFVQPSRINPLALKTLELSCLQSVQSRGFIPIELSPVAPLGCCAVLAPVNQDNVVSAARGVEVLADATNVLALHLATEYQRNPTRFPSKYACTQRHVRAQAYKHPDFTAHFSVLALATAGQDTGHFAFEAEAVADHIVTHHQLSQTYFPTEKIAVKIWLRRQDKFFKSQIKQTLLTHLPDQDITWVDPAEPHNYYPQLQFKIFLRRTGQELDLADGGLVDWTQQLLNNRKQRLMISGLGLELLAKMRNNKG